MGNALSDLYDDDCPPAAPSPASSRCAPGSSPTGPAAPSRITTVLTALDQKTAVLNGLRAAIDTRYPRPENAPALELRAPCAAEGSPMPHPACAEQPRTSLAPLAHTGCRACPALLGRPAQRVRLDRHHPYQRQGPARRGHPRQRRQGAPPRHGRQRRASSAHGSDPVRLQPGLPHGVLDRLPLLTHQANTARPTVLAPHLLCGVVVCAGRLAAPLAWLRDLPGGWSWSPHPPRAPAFSGPYCGGLFPAPPLEGTLL